MLLSDNFPPPPHTSPVPPLTPEREHRQREPKRVCVRAAESAKECEHEAHPCREGGHVDVWSKGTHTWCQKLPECTL